jgi:hypothetical protein
MLDKFWEAAGEKLADRWAGASVPAVIFWLGGLLCWISGHGGTSDLRKVAEWAGKQSAPVQLVILLTALLGVAASGVIVQRLATVGLRLIEGYWPSFAGRLVRRRTKTIAAKAKSLEDRYQELAGPVLEDKSATAAQRAEFAGIDQRLRRFPVDGDYLPTKTGNIMRAGERRPAEKYGLDAIVVWPRLWLLLPDGTRGELSQARSALDSAVAALIWGVLFFGFTALAWWAALVAIAVVLAMYLYWIPDRAAVFADLLESAFDVHRGLLYQSLRWPLPENPRDEHVSGEQVTSYLLRGLDGDEPTFTSDTRVLPLQVRRGGRGGTPGRA